MKTLVAWTWLCCAFGTAFEAGSYADKKLNASPDTVVFVVVVSAVAWPMFVIAEFLDP